MYAQSELADRVSKQFDNVRTDQLEFAKVVNDIKAGYANVGSAARSSTTLVPTTASSAVSTSSVTFLSLLSTDLLTHLG